MIETWSTRQVGVKTNVPRPLANQLAGPGDKSVARKWCRRSESNRHALFRQRFLSSLPSIFQRFGTTTNVHDLATSRIRLGRPRTSASSQQLLANVLNVGGKFQRGDDGCRRLAVLISHRGRTTTISALKATIRKGGNLEPLCWVGATLVRRISF
jgi:hypothetical protein